MFNCTCGKRTELIIMPKEFEVLHDGVLSKVLVDALPVYKCVDCGEMYYDYLADSVISQAIREHHGLLNPYDIIEWMGGMPVDDLSSKLGITSKLLSKILSGSLISSSEVDKALRVLMEKQ